MIEIISYIFIILSSLFLLSLSLWYAYILYQHKKKIHDIFDIQEDELLTKRENTKKEEFKQKLMRAGLSKQNFYEIILASIVTGASLISLIFIMNFSMLNNIFLALIGVSIALFMPFIYLEEQIKARIKRIENDLAVFIDLLIIILEGGGGLNNAIDKVTVEGASVLGKDLLYESKMFKNEFITYGSEVAYTNLASRTGSEAIATIVGFMRLSEETGIGVKTIFENQAQDIKSAEILGVEKKAATMNISITFVMFVFIIPAVIAMIAFPMAADALMPGF
jgi:tight adherence protein C